MSDNNTILFFLQVQNQRLAMLTQPVWDGDFLLFLDKLHLHYTMMLHKKFMKFVNDFNKARPKLRGKSQLKEIQDLLLKHQGIGLPNFLSHSILHHLVKHWIESIADTCIALVEEAFEYANKVVSHMNTLCSESYLNMEKCFKKFVIEALETTKKTMLEFVERMLGKKSTNVFTTNNYYLAIVAKMYVRLEDAK